MKFSGSEDLFELLEGEYDRTGTFVRLNSALTAFLGRSDSGSPPTIMDLLSPSACDARINRLFSEPGKEMTTICALRPGERKVRHLCIERADEKSGVVRLTALALERPVIAGLLREFSRLEGLYNGSPDIIITVDSSWKVADINGGGYRKLGYGSREEVCGLSAGDIFVLSGEAMNYITGELGKGNAITEFEILLKKKGGGYITGFASIFSPGREHDRQETFFVHIKDMTLQTEAFAGQLQTNMELSELNEELNRAYASMLSQEKMAALGLLSAGMAHEINNPLGFIFNNVGVLMNHFRDLKSYVFSVRNLYGSCPQLVEIESLDSRLDLDYIFEDIVSIEKENSEGIDRIKKLIGSLNSFSRKDRTERMSYYDLNGAVRDTLIITKNEYKYSVDIEEEYGEVRQFVCMAAEINQVLLNLLINAIEAVQSVKNRRGRGRILIRTDQDGKYSYFRISDNGPGIDEETAKKIFDPFYTTKSAGAGSGLGLTLAHDIIVNKHLGRLELVDSSEGACFLVSIPRNLTMPGE